MRLTATLSVRLREQAVVDVVVLLQRALGPLDQLGDAGAEVVAQQRLLLVLRPVVLQQVQHQPFYYWSVLYDVTSQFSVLYLLYQIPTNIKHKTSINRDRTPAFILQYEMHF